MSRGLIRFARASYYDVGKLCYTIYMNLFSQSNEALQSELNYIYIYIYFFFYFFSKFNIFFPLNVYGAVVEIKIFQLLNR